MMQQTVCDECPNVKFVNEERLLEIEVCLNLFFFDYGTKLNYKYLIIIINFLLVPGFLEKLFSDFGICDYFGFKI